VIAQHDGKPITIENELRSYDASNENENVEKANESLLGAPTVIIQHLRKTFKTFLAVDELNFNMYENQIFALLGHNGAGKVRIMNFSIILEK
jgi:ABC-type polysaccharide/polyol phosphate transport system ATPase subunit